MTRFGVMFAIWVLRKHWPKVTFIYSGEEMRGVVFSQEDMGVEAKVDVSMDFSHSMN